MDDVTKKWLEKRVKIVFDEIQKTGLDIEKLTDNFEFGTRRFSYLEECEVFYQSGEFCHDENSLEKYCLLCPCNNYNHSKDEGGCKINNPFERGYYYDRSFIGMSKIWDCSNCDYPHTRKATVRAFEIVKENVLEGKDLNNVLWELFTGNLLDEKV